MRFQKWKHENVMPNGTFSDGTRGAVETKPGVTYSQPAGGCDVEHCNCSQGHWMCIGFGLNDGVVEGITIYFDNAREMAENLPKFQFNQN